jgi:hypothetical protein
LGQKRERPTEPRFKGIENQEEITLGFFPWECLVAGSGARVDPFAAVVFLREVNMNIVLVLDNDFNVVKLFRDSLGQCLRNLGVKEPPSIWGAARIMNRVSESGAISCRDHSGQPYNCNVRDFRVVAICNDRFVKHFSKFFHQEPPPFWWILSSSDRGVADAPKGTKSVVGSFKPDLGNALQGTLPAASFQSCLVVTNPAEDRILVRKLYKELGFPDSWKLPDTITDS